MTTLEPMPKKAHQGFTSAHFVRLARWGGSPIFANHWDANDDLIRMHLEYAKAEGKDDGYWEIIAVVADMVNKGCPGDRIVEHLQNSYLKNRAVQDLYTSFMKDQLNDEGRYDVDLDRCLQFYHDEEGDKDERNDVRYTQPRGGAAVVHTDADGQREEGAAAV